MPDLELSLFQPLVFKEAADYLRISAGQLYKLMRKGEGPPCFRLGAVYRFDVVALDAWRFAQEGATRLRS